MYTRWSVWDVKGKTLLLEHLYATNALYVAE